MKKKPNFGISRFSKSALPALAAMALLLCLAGLSWGQTTGSGTISGTVFDPKQAVVPGASVNVHSTDTGSNLELQTNESGLYSAPFLPPGNYEITVAKSGFSKLLRKNIVLQVGQTMSLDLSLGIQATAETVTVTGEVSVVDSDKTEMSQVLSQVLKDNLPTAGRRWESFALLTPNVTNDGGTGMVSYRGVSGLYNSSAVDGTNNNQAFFSEGKGRTATGVPYVYSSDSIQEFQVTSSNYSAELGQAAGGVVNAVTKSGANATHGDLFYYLRYPTLNALDPINKSKGIYSQPVHQQQQFGGSAGGAIIHDKLFYFLTYDGSRKVSPITYASFATFPLPCTSSQITPAQCAAANNYFASQLGVFPKFFSQDVAFGKLDYQLTSKHRLSSSFNWDNFRAPNSYGTSTTNNNSSLSQSGPSITHERIFVATLASTLTPTIFNSVRFQWSRDLEIQGANGTGPSVSVQNVMAYGMPNALPRAAFPDEHRIQIGDVLSISRGRHTLKMGGDVNLIHELLINLFQGGGVYSYSGATAFNNWAADVMGINLGDTLGGLPATGRHFSTFVQVNDPVYGNGKDDFYNNDLDAFVEDSWKARPNLTFNLGLRWDIQMVPQPARPNLATPLTTLYTSKINIDHKEFGPRLGMAWSLAKETVVRAGFGIFYAKTSNSTFYATRAENGVFQQTFNCNATTCPLLSFPNLIFAPPGGKPTAPFQGAATPQVVPFVPGSNTATTRGQSPDFQNPRVYEGELGIERRLPGNISASATYVFSRGLRLPVFVDANIAPSTTTKTYDITNSAGATQSTLTEPFYTTRIDPTGPILTGFSDVNSWYHSLVLTAKKRISHGVEFLANYTLSRAEDGGQAQGQFGTFNGTISVVDPYHRNLEYGLSDLNQRHRFVTNLVWIPQFTQKIGNHAAKMVFDGFRFSTIVLAATGQPVTGVINGSPSGGPAGGLTGAVVNNSGTAQSSNRFPGEPRNSFTGPGAVNVDFRIGRDFKIVERVRLSLVGEAFNLFNHTNITTFNNTQFNYTAAGSGVCAGHTNGCVVANAPFLSPTASSNNLGGARQLQISGRLTF